MTPYNIEIFNRDFEYQSSYQVQNIEYNVDYLSIESNSLIVQKIQAAEGDYIRITKKEKEINGIITGCEETNKGYELHYKPILAVTDIAVHYEKEKLKEMSLEEWIAHILNDTYRDNEDTLQNISGFSAAAVPETYHAIITQEENIGNLYQIITDALLRYDVIVEFTLDISNKGLKAFIKKQKKKLRTIEADLPNIIDKNFMIKKSDESVNKLVIYNSKNENQYIAFYLLQDGSITAANNADGRINPVIFKTEFIAHEEKNEQTFEEAAYEKAATFLMTENYNNLIEITVLSNDKIVNPEELEIGQKVCIIKEEKEYKTVLTGKKSKSGTITLVFGAVRMELTKILKRRLQK